MRILGDKFDITFCGCLSMQFKIARIYFAEQRTVESGEIIAERVIEYSSRFDSSNLRHSRIDTGFNRNFRRYVVIGIIEIINNLALEGKSNNGLIAEVSYYKEVLKYLMLYRYGITLLISDVRPASDATTRFTSLSIGSPNSIGI